MPAKVEKRNLIKRSDFDDVSMSRSVASAAGRDMEKSMPRQVETERGVEVRLPIEYGSINEAFSPGGDINFEFSRTRGQSDVAGVSISVASGRLTSQSDLGRASAAMSRYKYYNKIAAGGSSRFIMPNHVVPSRFLLILPFKSTQKQSSVITIFSIWNTMMGTSLLSMPWAIKEAGFATSFVVLFVMTALTFYTAYRVLDSYATLVRQGVRVSEFSDVCRFYLGRTGEIVAVFFSAVALLGAVIVYWVLLSNFLYQTGRFVYNAAYNEPASDATPGEFAHGNRTLRVLCPQLPATQRANISDWQDGGLNETSPMLGFPSVWSKTDSVPFYLLLLLLPLVSVKSPSFFSKFNALGTVSVFYILAFVCVKAASWGLNLDFRATEPEAVIEQFSPRFFSFTGILSVALFCHCFLIVLIKPAKNPRNNPRDLLIAYVCVSATYLVIGGIFYTTYPLAKSCIEQNFLDNIPGDDVLAFTARIFLFIQMLTVFPLLMYILRAQLMYYFFRTVYPSWLHVFLMHSIVISLALLVSHFYPNIGNILRFSGAICGLAYIFTLPSLVYLVAQRQAGRLTPLKLAAHVLIMLVGGVNFFAQFVFV